MSDEKKKKIEPEVIFFFKLLWSIIKIPFRLILMLFGKRKMKHVFEPVYKMGGFLKQAKATYWLIIINILVFAVVNFMFIIGRIDQGFIEMYFVNHPLDLIDLNFLPVIGSWFMHSGLMHLFGNMLFLFVLGRVVEEKWGAKRFLVVYFGSAIISTIFNSIMYIFIVGSNIGGLGASGAIAGVASVAMLLNPFYLSVIAFSPVFLIGWLFLLGDVTGVLSGVNDGIGHFAHLGGFFAIGLLAFVFSTKERKELLKGFVYNLIALGVVVIVWWVFVKGRF